MIMSEIRVVVISFVLCVCIGIISGVENPRCELINASYGLPKANGTKMSCDAS